MNRLILVLACVMSMAGIVPVAGAAGDEATPQISRIESLEIPGLTAGCHVCEWRPKFNQMPAADQCGEDDGGKGKVGLFECGFAQDCQRECHFIRCGTL